MTEGTAAKLLCDEKVRSAYLGGRRDVESILNTRLVWDGIQAGSYYLKEVAYVF